MNNERSICRRGAFTRCVDADELPDVLRMRHTVELYVCGGGVRKPLPGELVNVGGLAERD